MFEPGVSRRIGEITNAIKDVRGKRRPDFFVHGFGPRKLIQILAQLLTPRVVGLFAPGEPNHAVVSGHLFFFVQVVKSGDELARGEVAARAEDDN